MNTPTVSDGFTDEQLAEAARSPTLGPAYFSARDYVERHMAGAEAGQFEPLVKKAADEFYNHLLDSVQNYLIGNIDNNIQGEIWRTVDNAVSALLSGEKWAMNKYALGERYDCEKVRATVAAHAPKEVQDLRIADLEAENARLRSIIETHRRFA